MGGLDDSGTRMVRIATAKGPLEIACQVHGRPDAAAIVLIRGLGTQLIEWPRVLIDELVRGGLRVVVFDNRDAGLSGSTEVDYTLDDMAGDVIGLADALGINRFHVFGISLGGMIAQLLAVHHGERLGCLFSVMSTTGNPELPRPDAESRERLLASSTSVVEHLERDIENRAFWGSPGYPEPEEQRRRMATAACERAYRPEGVARQMRAAAADGSRVERLAGVRVPTLVIHGAEDRLLPPACGEDTARAISGAEFERVAGMGHNVPDALAPLIARRVLEFIAHRADALQPGMAP